MSCDLSILVPVYNEVETVELLLRRLHGVGFALPREIIAIDDASTDGSLAVLERLGGEGLIRLVAHRQNGGKGAAVRTGLAIASGRYVVVQDADLELDPSDLPALLEPVMRGEADVCYGNRFAGVDTKSLRLMPTYWANRILNGLSNRLNGLQLSDFNACYKLMRTDLFRSLAIAEDSFSIEPEIAAKLAHLGCRIAERPIHYTPRTVQSGKKIRVLDFLRYLKAMIYYRFVWRIPRELAAERRSTAGAILMERSSQRSDLLPTGASQHAGTPDLASIAVPTDAATTP